MAENYSAHTILSGTLKNVVQDYLKLKCPENLSRVGASSLEHEAEMQRETFARLHFCLTRAEDPSFYFTTSEHTFGCCDQAIWKDDGVFQGKAEICENFQHRYCLAQV